QVAEQSRYVLLQSARSRRSHRYWRRRRRTDGRATLGAVENSICDRRSTLATESHTSPHDFSCFIQLCEIPNFRGIRAESFKVAGRLIEGKNSSQLQRWTRRGIRSGIAQC